MKKGKPARHNILEPINFKKVPYNQEDQEEKQAEIKKMMDEGIIDAPTTTTEPKSDDSLQEEP